MYSINVFVTFSLAQLGMIRLYVRRRKEDLKWIRYLSVHIVGFILCAGILIITTLEKFTDGGWMTLLITSMVIGICYLIRSHYKTVKAGISDLDKTLLDFPTPGPVNKNPLNKKDYTAIQLVTGYSGFGVHTLLSVLTSFPNTYKNIIFASVAVIDSGSFKGAQEVKALEESVKNGLEKYVELARKLGFTADYRMTTGTDVVESAVNLCIDIAAEYPKSTVFTGQITFRLEKFYHRLLHNETAFAIQRHLQWHGLTTVILPIRMRA
jgi:K+ transporter